MRPFDWNVVIVGAWNQAIFTPQWVARTLFELAPEVAVEVKVAVDRPGPMMISHDGVSVVPGGDRLVLRSNANTSAEILRAAAVAARTLEVLAVTPVIAGGVNIRFQADRIPEVVQPFLRSDIDGRLADSGRPGAHGRMLRRALAWHAGRLNLDLVEGIDLSAVLLFNFERVSEQRGDLQDWFQHVDAMLAETRDILTEVLQLPMDDVPL